jgi:hypothetical protein
MEVLRGINRRLEVDVTDSLLMRMERYTSKEKTSLGCIEWVASTRSGYGAIKHQGRVHSAHCVAWIIANQKQVPFGFVIAHKCDNRICVNPDHLECVTAQKNNADLHARRVLRAPRGQEVPTAVLSEDIVQKIRSMYKPRVVTVKKIASDLGLNYWCVRNVCQQRTWKHVSSK